MLSPPRALLLLAPFALHANCAFVQTQGCDRAVVNNDGLVWQSLSVDLQQQSGQASVLSMEVHQALRDTNCSEALTTFSATLDQDMLGHHLHFDHTGSSECRSWNSHLDGSSQEYLVYPMMFDLTLPPLSTFDIRLQLETPEKRNAGCLKANITPALSSTTSKTLLWVPTVIFIFVLLVGILRGFNERTHDPGNMLRTSDLNLPGVGEYLSYLQFIFLSGSLSLQYPGFFQPMVGRLHLFSLFSRGPIQTKYMYLGVEDGIYAINGTYGGTSGLEHMHQIVGAPQTMMTWYNFIIAFLIISAAAALFVETVTACRGRLERKHNCTLQAPTSRRLSARVIAILRLILSYFTLPLCALSSYQLSAARQVPIYHMVSATLLIIASILAFVWLFRRLPAQSAGRLIHGVPKWYQKEVAGSSPYGNPDADKFFATTVVVLTFVRGAVIGGLQKYGPVQLALLATSEFGFLVAIRWLRAYSICTIGTIAPVCRLLVLTLMIPFVQGLTKGSPKSAIGYAILALHASMLFFGFLLPAIYHFSKICRNVVMYLTGQPNTKRPFDRIGDVEHSMTDLAPTSGQRYEHRTQTPISSNEPETPTQSEFPSNPRSPGQSSYGYFREPRHSSIRRKSGELKAPSVHSALSQVSTAYDPAAVSPPSSSHSGASNDIWHDTRSMPLGPRWHDYTYREGDAFYAAPSPAVPFASAARELVATPTSSKGASRIRLDGVGEALRTSIRKSILSFTSETQKPEASGFQVVRPGRPTSQPMTGIPLGESGSQDGERISSGQPLKGDSD